MPAMQRSDTTEAYANLLRRSAREGSLSDGRRVHEHLKRNGYESETYLGNLLVQMYGKCGSLEEALRVFEKMSRRDLYTWNIMITAFAENGDLDQALKLFESMDRKDVVSWNAMIAAYIRTGELGKSEQLFSQMPDRNTVSWNSLIAAYAHNGHHKMAFRLFWTMCLDGAKPSEITFINILEVSSLSVGRSLHSLLLTAGFQRCIKVCNAVITMYGECGSVIDAELTFDSMRDRDVVTWTAMMGAYARNGHPEKARKLFDKMPRKNVVSWNTMLCVYAQQGHTNQAMEVFALMEKEGTKPNRATFVSILAAGLEVEQGDEIHERIIQSGLRKDVMVATALCAMYGACGSLDKARGVFEESLELDRADLISWNCMITVYVQAGRCGQALESFHRLELEGIKPNDVTYLSALDACTSLSFQSQGRSLHHRLVNNGLLFTDVKLTNAVMNMYGKCGNISAAEEVFDSMAVRDIFSWNVMIATFGQNGLAAPAIHWFLVTCLEGFDPDSITFLELLSACSHAGLVETGLVHFLSMQEDWETEATPNHYQCMADLLGRSGQLVRTEELINTMPYEPEEGVWRTLLSGCRVNTDVQRGERATESLLQLETGDSSPYVLMSNIYACTDNWEHAKLMRRLMAEKNVKKQPGLSWIEIKGKMHTFAASDRLHPRRHEIYAALNVLFEELRVEGYEPDTRVALCDVEAERKVEMVLQHSEKLAIVFGMMNTPDRTTLTVFKNLRVCSDCHTAAKMISRLCKRKIVMRDGTRFHHFDKGSCSCLDYW